MDDVLTLFRSNGSTVVLTPSGEGFYTFSYQGEPYTAESEWEDGTWGWTVSYRGEAMAVRATLEDAVFNTLADVDQLFSLI